MEKFVYKPKGTCSQLMEFEIEGNVIKSLKVTGGCNGNLKGICSILRNKTLDEVIEAFDGIHCGPRSTSCPDQIACGLKKFKESHV